MGLAAAYVVLLPVLGYVAASALVLACFVLYLGQGRLVRALAVAVPTAFLLAELFWRGLNVPLPRAVWMG